MSADETELCAAWVQVKQRMGGREREPARGGWLGLRAPILATAGVVCEANKAVMSGLGNSPA